MRRSILTLACAVILATACGGPSSEGSADAESDTLTSRELVEECSSSLPSCGDLSGQACTTMNEMVSCCLADSTESSCICGRFGPLPLQYICAS